MSEALAIQAPRKRRVAKAAALALIWCVLASTAAWAAWFIIPDGTGNGYARGADATQGLALTTAVVTPNGSNTIGPGGNADLAVTVTNSNTVPVLITEIAQAGPAVKIGDATCTSNGSITLDTYGGGATVPAGGFIELDLALHASASFPDCFVSSEFRVPLTLKGVAA